MTRTSTLSRIREVFRVRVRRRTQGESAGNTNDT
jgi:hypothetical protein